LFSSSRASRVPDRYHPIASAGVPRNATAPRFEHDRIGAERRDAVELVRYDDHGDAAGYQFADSPESTLLESEVTDREDFIHDEDLRIEVRRDGESESGVHAAGVAFHLACRGIR
jgi:hypothetical protein